MHTDPISDYLTRLRNAVRAGLKIVDIPASNIKIQMTEVLFECGYIYSYKCEEANDGKKSIKIALKYDKVTGEPSIQCLKRISKPSLRKYVKSTNLPRVLNGLGIAIISTSNKDKAVISSKEAKKLNIGGEVLCYVY